jgi:hypothetical protein
MGVGVDDGAVTEDDFIVENIVAGEAVGARKEGETACGVLSVSNYSI